MNTPTINIIETGLARSVGEPRGRHGLEGDILDQSYRFERGEDGRGRYCRFFFRCEFSWPAISSRSRRRTEMIELTAKEREAVVQILRKHPDAGSDVDLDGFLKEKPLASHFFAMAARGQMKDRRVATDVYLRSLPDDLLERLALALREFKNDANGLEEDKRGSDLLLVLTLVIAQEKQVGGFKATDIELAVFMDRFAALADVEAERRAGIWRRVDRYTLLLPVTDKQPRRTGASKSKMEH
jgi:hypothetical protein